MLVAISRQAVTEKASRIQLSADPIDQTAANILFVLGKTSFSRPQ